MKRRVDLLLRRLPARQFVTNVCAHVFRSHAFYRYHFCTLIWSRPAGDESFAECLIYLVRLAFRFVYMCFPTECPSHPQPPYILVWAAIALPYQVGIAITVPAVCMLMTHTVDYFQSTEDTHTHVRTCVVHCCIFWALEGLPGFVLYMV